MFDSKFFIAKKFLDFDFPSGWAMFVAKKNHSQIILLILRVFPIHLDWQSTLYFDSSKSSRPFFHLPDNNTNDFIYLLWLEGQKSFESSTNLIIESIRYCDSNINADFGEINRYFISISSIFHSFQFTGREIHCKSVNYNCPRNIIFVLLGNFNAFLFSRFRFRACTERDKTGGKIFEEKLIDFVQERVFKFTIFFFLIILVKSLLNNVNVIFPFTKYSNETGENQFACNMHKNR